MFVNYSKIQVNAPIVVNLDIFKNFAIIQCSDSNRWLRMERSNSCINNDHVVLEHDRYVYIFHRHSTGDKCCWPLMDKDLVGKFNFALKHGLINEVWLNYLPDGDKKWESFLQL